MANGQRGNHWRVVGTFGFWHVLELGPASPEGRREQTDRSRHERRRGLQASGTRADRSRPVDPRRHPILPQLAPRPELSGGFLA